MNLPRSVADTAQPIAKLFQFIHIFLARPFLGHRVAAAATLKQLLLGAGDQKFANVTNATVATNVLGCTGDSHAAVRKQDVRGYGHFVTIWKQAAASTLGKDFAGRVLSAACAGLRDEIGSVQKEAGAAVHRVCMAEGRRKWWRRLLDSGAQMRSICDAANPALREASLDLLSRLCLLARSADDGAPDEVRSKLPPADNELLLVSCLIRLEDMGAVVASVDGVSQIREHVGGLCRLTIDSIFVTSRAVELVRKPEWSVADFLEDSGALPRFEGLSLWALKSHLCLSPRSGEVPCRKCLRGAAPSRGREEVRDLLPFRLSPDPNMTCARGEPVIPELIQEAAGYVSLRCHRVVAIAWSSLLRAEQCFPQRVCSCWRNGCVPTLSRK